MVLCSKQISFAKVSAVKHNLGYKLLSKMDVLLSTDRNYINSFCCFCNFTAYSAFSSFHLSRYSAPVGETPAGASTGRGPRHWASFPISTWQTSPAQDRTLWVHLLFYSYVCELKHGVFNKPHTRAPTWLRFSEFFSVQYLFGRLSNICRENRSNWSNLRL